MKKIILAFVMFLFFAPVLLTACRGQEKAPAGNYEIDPAKIVGQTVEEKLESLKGLLNNQTEGFSRVFYWYDSDAKETAFYLMVYGGSYGDKESRAKIDIILKQLFAWAVKFVSPEFEFIGIYMIDSEAEHLSFEMTAAGLRGLLNAPPESWKELLEPITILRVESAWQLSYQELIKTLEEAVGSR